MLHTSARGGSWESKFDQALLLMVMNPFAHLQLPLTACCTLEKLKRTAVRESANANDERECSNTTQTHPVIFDQIIISIKTAPNPTLIIHIHLNVCIFFAYNTTCHNTAAFFDHFFKKS